MARDFKIKGVYEPAADEDSFRVLVDRLWQGGIRKDNAKIDLWAKDIAPSDALRREFHGHPEHWEKFVAAYAEELSREPAASAARGLIARRKRVSITLLYAARDEEHNNAVDLNAWIEEQA